jgi:NADH-quinone oxidoreductase subunit M
LLLGIQLLGVLFQTFDLVEITQKWTSIADTEELLGWFGGAYLTAGQFKIVAFWAFVISFAIKVPVWPFHTWLPDAHTEAPNGWLNDSGWCAAQAWRVRFHSPYPAALSH